MKTKMNLYNQKLGSSRGMALCAALIAGLPAVSAFADTINVPSFGPYTSGAPGYVNKTANQTFGDGAAWTVSGTYNSGLGNVNVGGNNWQAPPGGGSTVQLDGNAPAGQIYVPVVVTSSGIVNVDFYLSGTPPLAQSGNFTYVQPKKIEVQLLSSISTATSAATLGAGIINSYDSTANTLANMNWLFVQDSFSVAAAGTYYLTISSLDDPGADLSNGSDQGPAIGSISITTGVPETGSSLLLLGLGIGSLFCLSRRVTAKA